MTQRIVTILKYYLFWIIFFIINRLFFVLYNFSQTAELTVKTVVQCFISGLKLDVSMGGYVTVLFALVVALTIKSKPVITKNINGFFTIFFIIIFSIIGICDCELYRNWGFRMDCGILSYLKTPKEAAASTPIWLIILFVIWVSVYCWANIKTYNYFIGTKLSQLKPTQWYALPLIVFIAAIFIIPIRGGFGMPIRSGSVFFSQHQFANHAAINVQWNFCNSFRYTKKQQKVSFMPQEQADSLVSALTYTNTVSKKLLKNTRPNVLIMIMESITAKAVGCIGSKISATPNLDSISHHGILFTNCYASGDRSDKGIVSILSGYPAQPTTSIMKTTEKAEKLPHISQKLHAEGYQSSFYYGGDIDFANMRSYFIMGKHNYLVSINDFSKSDMNSKWGAHDHVVLNRWFSDINNMKQPFYSTLFTLSSHEPFDVPHKSHFDKTDDESLFLNSIHYTDSCIGDFVRKASLEPWWDNTLLIMVADHGSRHPHNSALSDPQRYHIPMIWIGGALNVTDTTIDKFVSQIDIATMLLNQLEIDNKEFCFGKDVINGSNGFCFYAYNNGYGYLTDSVQFTYDITSTKISANDTINTKTIMQSQAFLQTLLNDFNLK